MSWARVFVSRLRGLIGHKRLERELDEEVRFHLEMQIEDNLKAGMNPAEAQYAARRSFRAIEPMKETYRDRRAFAFLDTTAQDVRYAPAGSAHSRPCRKPPPGGSPFRAARRRTYRSSEGLKNTLAEVLLQAHAGGHLDHSPQNVGVVAINVLLAGLGIRGKRR
jgi:hypothetical protein